MAAIVGVAFEMAERMLSRENRDAEGGRGFRDRAVPGRHSRAAACRAIGARQRRRMKALVCRANRRRYRHARRSRTSRCRDLGRDEVRIRVRAAAVNFPDILMVQGKYQHKPELPFIAGRRARGRGDRGRRGRNEVESRRPRDRRRAVRRLRAGSAGAGRVRYRRIPDGVDYATAAGFHRGLSHRLCLAGPARRRCRPARWLLVHGAAGGVGLAASISARCWARRVIATASSDAKRAFLKDYGADHVLPSSGFREAVKEMTGGRGADVIYDPVGGDVFDEIHALHRLRRTHRWSSASPAGRIPSITVNMPLIKGFSVMGVRAGEYGRKFPEKGRENIAAIDAIAGGRKTPSARRCPIPARPCGRCDAHASEPPGNRKSD